jgi:hypothetical protein
VFPVRYELSVLFQKTAFFIVTAVKSSNITQLLVYSNYDRRPQRKTKDILVLQKSEINRIGIYRNIRHNTHHNKC